MNKIVANQRLEALSIPDMPVVEIPALVHSISADWFSKYKEIRREFMESLGDSIEDLSMLQMDQSEFMGLLSGKALPENLTIRLRIPLLFGGKIELTNMFLCKTFPHSQNIDRFIIEQSGNYSVWLPNPLKKIYLPIHNLSGGDGGNVTGDKFFKYLNAQGRE